MNELKAIARLVTSSSLDWTFVRFLQPTDGPYTGHPVVTFGDVKAKIAVSREDIGAFMAHQLDTDEYIHSMPILGGKA